MEKSSTPLDDTDRWSIEASLRPAGPVLRHRVRKDSSADRATVGQMFLVSEPALFTEFEARAHALTHVRHPTVPPPIRLGRHRGRPYRLDRLISAPRLSAVREGRSQAQVLRLVCQIAEGLSVLHRHGVIHGSLHPCCISIIDEVDGLQAIFTEIPAISVGPWVPDSAPEVRQGRGAEPRTDVFGLGLVFWTLATGRDPRRESRAGWADTRPGAVLPVGEGNDLTDANRALLRSMLDRDPTARPPDLSTVLTLLHPQSDVAPPTKSLLPSPRPTLRPRPPPAAVPHGDPHRLDDRRFIGIAALTVALLGVGTLALLFLDGAKDDGIFPSQMGLTAAPVAEHLPPAPRPSTRAHQGALGDSTGDAGDSSADAMGTVSRVDLAPTPREHDSRHRSRPTDDHSHLTKTVAPAALHVGTAPPSAMSAAALPREAGSGSSPRISENGPAMPSPGAALTVQPASTADGTPLETADATPSKGSPEVANSTGSAPVGGSQPPLPEAKLSPQAPSKETSSAGTAAALAGSWKGVVHGRAATVRVYAAPDGSLFGLTTTRAGVRQSHHPIVGRYRVNASGSISVSLVVQGTRAAWTGRVLDGRFSGVVQVNGKERGEFSLER